MLCAPPCRDVVGCYIGRVGQMVEGRAGGRRADGRRAGELRPVRLVPRLLPPPQGAVPIEKGAPPGGGTATGQESVPPLPPGQGPGWGTAPEAPLARRPG